MMMILVCSIIILFASISNGYIINRSYDRYSIVSYAKNNKKIESDESKPSPEKNLFPKIGVGAGATKTVPKTTQDTSLSPIQQLTIRNNET